MNNKLGEGERACLGWGNGREAGEGSEKDFFEAVTLVWLKPAMGRSEGIGVPGEETPSVEAPRWDRLSGGYKGWLQED